MTPTRPVGRLASTLVAGLGCRSGVSVETLHAAVGCALVSARRWWDEIALLAVPDFKDGSNFDLLAERLGLTLVLVRRAELEGVQDRCLTHSPAAERLTGLGTVAEAAALAAAGAGATLLGPRTVHDGATCALAQRAAP
jgi:cobalt-precorrin 5A hydrolase